MRRTFGITMATAYPLNTQASGIWKHPWKHNEFSHSVGASAGDPILTMYNQGSATGTQPNCAPFCYMSVLKAGLGTETQAQCNATVAASSRLFGTSFCDNVGNWQYGAGNNYNRSTHWPNGEWGCVRGFFENVGTANARRRVWLTTSKVTDLPIVDITINESAKGSKNGYGGLFWDSYSNANIPGSGFGPTTQVTYRYEDNIHIRTGTPVSCAQIGFGQSGPPNSPPGPPTNVITR
jgi:hypothetical protein